ncbi:serine protease inhibitor swm-1-like [Oppia nitens]|uniref:serine protease inhibitor swm-1-like n=1 Tax=Oppia nitens TaxID=1686743 RepID=UPI0023DB93F5|nr:serine protease inhibitor swm-1-like [Oppia nitens]
MDVLLVSSCGLFKCTNGTQCCCRNPCPATCADPIPSCCLSLNCEIGCFKVCPKGSVLDKYGGNCIPLQCCPSVKNLALVNCQTQLNGKCRGGPIDTNVKCGTLTPDVCGCPTVSNTSKACIRDVCQCAPGYWRRLADCKCVFKSECDNCVGYAFIN